MNTGLAENNSIRILCVSPVFVPSADPEAFCGAKMVQALMYSGAVVTVLSSSNFRERPVDGSALWDSVKEAIVDVPVPRSLNKLHSIVAATQFQTPFDARWVRAAVRKAKLLHTERAFDLVYTRSLPIASHIVGFWCAKSLGLPWIANINDPWTSEFFPVDDNPQLSSFWSAANLFWLRRTIRSADLTTFPCKRLKDFHLRLAKLDQHAQVVPHVGYKRNRESQKPDGQFRLVHAGRLLASEGRSGKAILLGLKEFLKTFPDAAADVRLILVGPGDLETDNLICEMGLQRNIDIVGRVNYENSLDYISVASACILIESRVDEGIFFASKLADYLAYAKPVLALSPKIGTAADLANRGELIRIDQNPEAVKGAIATLYGEFKKGALSSRAPSEQLQTQVQGHVIAEKFLAICQTLTLTRLESRAVRLKRMRQQGPLFERSF